MSSKKCFAVVLSGCGVFDGSEIHEATLTLYAIKLQGADYEIFAPNVDQFHVINHLTGEVQTENRNIMIEAARLARGKVRPLNEYKASEFDAIIFPGGFGVAKNLCTFAFDGPDCKVLPEVEKAIKETAAQSKPIGALCISPVLIARVLGGVTITIGQDESTIKAVEALGAIHIKTNQCEVAIDPKNKIVTTPCYMLDADISQIGEGAINLVKEIIRIS